METIESLVKALRVCNCGEDCSECPYSPSDDFCQEKMINAADAIEELLADNERLEEALRQVTGGSDFNAFAALSVVEELVGQVKEHLGERG